MNCSTARMAAWWRSVRATMNFRHYPATTTAVTAVEPEPHLRDLATQAARDVSVPVMVLPGTADDLPLENASADVGVVSLMLCALDDQRAGLAELYRVIRPRGELRFLEHVAAETLVLRAVQRRRHGVATAHRWLPHRQRSPLLRSRRSGSRWCMCAASDFLIDASLCRRLHMSSAWPDAPDTPTPRATGWVAGRVSRRQARSAAPTAAATCTFRSFGPTTALLPGSLVAVGP